MQRKLNGEPRDSVAGISLSPCCFASLGKPIRCERSAEVWPVVSVKRSIWVCMRHRNDRHFHMPMNIGHGNCTRRCFTNFGDNARYRILEEKPLPRHRNILSDQIIEMEVFYSHQKYPGRLRRIEVWDEINERVIMLLTNNMTFGTTTIAAIYKERWQIEIFFKTIKQNLRIKTFVGTSSNTLLIQI